MLTQRTGAVMLRLYFLMRGSVSRVLPLFAWSAFDIVLWGFLTRFLNSVNSAGLNFVAMFLGAVLLWDFFVRVMQGVSMGFFEDVWSRNFLNIFATPITISEYVTGLVLWSVLTSFVGLSVMIVMARALFHLSFFIYGAMLVAFIFVLYLFGIALGIFSTAVVLRLGPASEWFIWPIPAFLTPLAGVFYPLSILPKWMQGIGHLLPPAYVFENMRAITLKHAASWTGLLVSGSLAIVYIALACWFFTRTYRYAVRTGLFARFSAESVT